MSTPKDNPSTSRSILGWLRDTGAWWLGIGKNQLAENEVRQEKIKSGPSGIRFPWFLPFHDDKTGETQAMRLAYRRMVSDPNVKAAWLGKLFSVTSRTLQVVPADKKNPHDQAVAEFVRWNLVERVEGGMGGLIWSIFAAGLVDGYSVNEKVWKPQTQGKWSGKIPLNALKPKDTQNDVILETDDYRNIIAVKGLRYNPGVELSPANFLIWANLPMYGQPTGMSDFRAVYSRYWLLDTVLKLRAMGLEKRSLPLLVGEYVGDEQRASMENELAQVARRNWFAIPQGARISALEIAGGSDAMYASAIADLKEDIFLGIQLATLQALTGGIGEMRGNSKVHQSNSQLAAMYLVRAFESLLNDGDSGLIKDIVDLNFVVSEYPRASLTAVDPEEMLRELQIDQGLQSIGLKASKEATYEKYGRTPPKGPDDELQAPNPGQPPPGGPPGMPPAPGGGGGDLDRPFDEEVGPFTAKPKSLEKLDDDEPAPVASSLAPAGADGEKALELARKVVANGVDVLTEIGRAAVKRLIKNPQARSAFTQPERERLAAALATANATGELLGRARVQRRLEQAQSPNKPQKFSEAATDFTCFQEPIESMTPADALDYFSWLVPSLNLDPLRFGQSHERDAFTLAEATDRVVLRKVRDAIRSVLQSGQASRGPEAVQSVLDAAGISPANPQYAEMVFRTNSLDAYNTGATKEMQKPHMMAEFPVWQYSGIADGRQGADHAPHFDRYYPASRAFAEVRGPRVFNCVLPGNNVSGRIVAGLKARYSGEAIEIHTASGSRLAVTPNHPVLSQRGFVPAGSIKKGQRLLCDLGKDKPAASEIDEQDSPALIEDVFGALQVLVGTSRRTPVASLDLHGDAESTDGEVHVVRPDLGLMLDGNLHHSQRGRKLVFAGRGVGKASFPGLGSLDLNLDGITLSSPLGVGSGSLLDSGLSVHAPPFEEFGGASATSLDTGVGQANSDDVSADTEGVRQLLLRFPGLVTSDDFGLVAGDRGISFIGLADSARFDAGLVKPAGESLALDAELISELLCCLSGEVAFDEVIEVRRFHYDGPVFDLETTQGYYTAGSEGPRIFISNCRCTPIPIDRDSWQELQASGAHVERYSEVWTAFEASDWTQQKGPRGGVYWVNAAGRKVYGKTNPGGEGKTAKPKAGKATKADKPSLDSVHARFTAAASGPITHEAGEALKADLLTLTVKDLTALKRRLGVKASGPKAQMAAQIAERAMAKKQPAKPKEPPAKVGPAPLSPDALKIERDLKKGGQIDYKQMAQNYDVGELAKSLKMKPEQVKAALTELENSPQAMAASIKANHARDAAEAVKRAKDAELEAPKKGAYAQSAYAGKGDWKPVKDAAGFQASMKSIAPDSEFTIDPSVSVPHLNELGKVLADLTGAGHRIPKSVQIGGAGTGGGHSFSPDGAGNGHLKITPGLLGNSRAAADAYASGWYSTPDPYHTMIHELGHYANARMARNPRYAEAEELMKKNRDKIRSEVGQYADADKWELVAEVYTGLHLGMKFGPEVMETYKVAGGPPVVPREGRKQDYPSLPVKERRAFMVKRGEGKHSEEFAEYHGPESPGEGWTLAGKGPHGGSIWKKEDASPHEKINAAWDAIRFGTDPDRRGLLSGLRNNDPSENFPTKEDLAAADADGTGDSLVSEHKRDVQADVESISAAVDNDLAYVLAAAERAGIADTAGIEKVATAAKAAIAKHAENYLTLADEEIADPSSDDEPNEPLFEARNRLIRVVEKARDAMDSAFQNARWKARKQS